MPYFAFELISKALIFFIFNGGIQKEIFLFLQRMSLQWSWGQKVPLWYLLYKMGLAMVFVVILCLSISNYQAENLSPNYFVLLTNQGMVLLTLNFTLDACLVGARWLKEKRLNPDQESKLNRDEGGQRILLGCPLCIMSNFGSSY